MKLIKAEGLTQYGLEKQLERWQAPKPIFKELKELTRELNTNTIMITQLKNRLHAKEHSHEANLQTVKRLNQQIAFFNKLQKMIQQQINDLVKSDKDLDDRIQKIITTKGIGFKTAVGVICETNGFELINNQRQLTSYAGYDPKLNQSGLFKGKTAISKKGNKHLRTAVFLPALAAVRHNEMFKALYKRLCISKNNKSIALIAIARKLLVLIYTLWKKNQVFDLNYKHPNQQHTNSCLA